MFFFVLASLGTLVTEDEVHLRNNKIPSELYRNMFEDKYVPWYQGK